MKKKLKFSPVLNSQYLRVKVSYILKALFVSYRVDQQEAVTLTHILFTHCTEFLLTCCVQYWNETNIILE